MGTLFSIQMSGTSVGSLDTDGVQLPPGVYAVEAQKTYIKAAKSGNGENWWLEGVVIGAADPATESVVGTKIKISAFTTPTENFGQDAVNRTLELILRDSFEIPTEATDGPVNVDDDADILGKTFYVRQAQPHEIDPASGKGKREFLKFASAAYYAQTKESFENPANKPVGGGMKNAKVDKKESSGAKVAHMATNGATKTPQPPARGLASFAQRARE